MNVRLLRRAVQDLDDIRRYVERDRPEAAQRLVARLLGAAESLGENPQRATLPKDDRLRGLGYRFAVVAPYLLFFQIRGTNVQIHRVLNGHRRYRALL